MRAATLLTALSVALLGCPGVDTTANRGLSELASALPAPPATDLLARARASVEGGRISEAMVAALAASPHPRDQAAARLLERLDAPPATVEEPEPSAAEFSEAPRIKLGSAPVPTPEAKAPAPAAKARTSTRHAAPLRPRARLERVGLSSTKRGASLSLRGSGGLVVGVASQPASGIVRLVMDAEASTGALRSRPRITGARVTGIRRTGKTVFVTLALDPGWSLKGIVRTRSGARVDLTAPA